MKFGNGYPSMGEDPNGEYVKWEEVKDLITITTDHISVPPQPVSDGTILIKEGESPKKSPIPACVNCKHQTYKSGTSIKGQKFTYGLPLCTRKKYISPVYGECFETTQCWQERESFFGCGKKGKYFEPKEKGNM